MNAGRSNRSQGVALISVLLVMAVLVAVVYRLSARHSLNLAQSQNSIGFDRALAYALGGEALARQVLIEDLTKSDTEVDTLLEPWAQAIPPFEVDEVGFLEVQARDLNGCFNLNALVGEQGDLHFSRLKTLLQSLGVPATIADAAWDWMDADQEVFGFGAEDDHYLMQQPAYATSGRRLMHVSEVRLLQGADAKHLQALMPHVCALPSEVFKINVNTATSHLLAALEPELSEAELQHLTSSERVYESVADFVSEHQAFASTTEFLSVASEYFEVQVRVQLGGSIAVLTSVLHRDPEGPVIRLLSRDLGRDYQSRFEANTEDA